MKMRQTILAVAIGAGVTMPAMATNGNQAVASGQSARGNAGAGIAYPQDTLAVGINPAAGVHLGNRIDAGIELFKPDRGFTVHTAGSHPRTGVPYPRGTFDGNGTDVFIVPEFGYNRMLRQDSAGNDRAFTISVSAAGGQNTDYSNHAILAMARDNLLVASTGKLTAALLTDNPAYVNLEQLFIQPTFSSKVGENHSFGIGAIFAFQTFEARGLEPFANAAFSSSPNNVTGNGRVKSHGVGLSVGWIGKVSDRLTLGATYQSKIEMSKFKGYQGLIPGGSIDIPAKAGVGLAFAATPKWDILFDITHTFYSDTDALGNSTKALPLGTPGVKEPPLGKTTGFGWEDQTVYKLGMVYKHSPKLILRAGLNYGKNPTPNETFNDTFFNSLTAGITEKHASLGFTYRIKPKISLTGSYVRTFEKKLSGNGASHLGSGNAPDLRVDQDAIGISIGWEL